MQTYDETRLLKRSPLSTTGTPSEYHRNPKIMCYVLLTSNAIITPPPFNTSHGGLLNNDRPGVRFINTWDLQLLFHSYGCRGSFRLDSYFYVLPLFQKYILSTLQVQVCLGFLVTWFHEKAVKTKDKNLVNWQSINSSNNLQYFESGTPSKGGKSFCMVDNVIVNYLWKQSWSPALLGKGGK